jgi:hypothetical protein
VNAIIVSQLEKALAAKVDAMALKPRVRVKAKGIPMAVTTPKPKPTKKGAKK